MSWFSPRFNGTKLKVNLKLCITRLQMLQKKKGNQSVLARKDVANLIKKNKIELARIRTEQIIRDDYTIEVFEILELYCSLLTSRFGLIEASSSCDEGLKEAVCTLMWVAPRLKAEVQELAQISKALGLRYGKEFIMCAMGDTATVRVEGDPNTGIPNTGRVSKKVKGKLSALAPEDALVDSYMVAIGEELGAPYKPPPRLPPTELVGDDFAAIGGASILDFPSAPGAPGAPPPGGGTAIAPGFAGASGIDLLFPSPPAGNPAFPPPINSFPGAPAPAAAGPGVFPPGSYPPPVSTAGPGLFPPGAYPPPVSTAGPGVFPPAGPPIAKQPYLPPAGPSAAPSYANFAPPSFEESIRTSLPIPGPGAQPGPAAGYDPGAGAAAAKAAEAGLVRPRDDPGPMYQEIDPAAPGGGAGAPTYLDVAPEAPAEPGGVSYLDVAPVPPPPVSAAAAPSVQDTDLDDLTARFNRLKDSSGGNP